MLNTRRVFHVGRAEKQKPAWRRGKWEAIYGLGVYSTLCS